MPLFGIKSLVTKQLVNTIHKMVGHVQAQTPVGFQFRITIYAYQLFLGTWFPFFELNPADFPHRHGTTHS